MSGAMAWLLLAPVPIWALTYSWNQIPTGSGWSINPSTLNSNSITVYMASGTNALDIVWTGTVTNTTGSAVNITDTKESVFSGLSSGLSLFDIGSGRETLRIYIGTNGGGNNILNMAGSGNQFTSDGFALGQPSSTDANNLIVARSIAAGATETITVTFSFLNTSGSGGWTATRGDTAITMTFNP